MKVYIERDFDGLKEAVVEMLGGRPCRIRPEKFQNDMTTFGTKDDVLTLLVHLGYLSYDGESGEVFIPNLEITQEFLNVVDSPSWGGLTDALNRSEELLRSTWALDGEAVAAGMSAMNPVMELPSGKGYADVVYLPKRDTARPALVVELKWNKSARGAIAQIKDRQYASWIQGYTGDILLVGIAYDKKSKEHACAIEAWKKEE